MAEEAVRQEHRFATIRGQRLVSLAVHLVGVAAAFMLARRLTKNADVAFWTALLFGIHPVQVEPVGVRA